MNGAGLDDGKIEITAKRKRKSKDAGVGELSVGKHYSEQFTWDLRKRKINF